MANLEKRTADVLLLMASKQVHMSHIQSCINSMRNIMVLILRSIQKEKNVLRQPRSMHNNKVSGKEDLFNALE